MTAVTAVARSLFRRRWWSVIALGLLVGIAGGAVIAAAAGARRTETAYPRLNEESAASDVQVSPVVGDVDLDEVAALPQVERSGRLYAFSIYPDEDGLAAPQTPSAFASADGHLYYDIDRPFLVEGRMPAPDAVDEIVVNGVLSEQRDLGIGDRFPVTLIDFPGLFELAESGAVPDAEEFAELQHPVDLEVVGISRSQAEIMLVEDDISDEAMLLGPAFAEEYEGMPAVETLVVELDDGSEAAVAAFTAEVRDLFPDAQIEFPTLTGKLDTVGRALQPYEDLLRIFAIVTGITAFLVLGQALARQVAGDAVDVPTLRAIGMSRVRLVGALSARGVVVGLAGGVLAVVVAVSVSGVFPFGQARLAEPDRGIRLEVPVLLIGFVLVVLLTVARTIVAAAWAVRRRRRRARSGVGSTVVDGLGRAGMPLEVTTGVGFAVQAPDDTRGWFVTPLIGLVVAATATATVLVFGASLDRVTSTPRLYGWNWDVLIEGYDGTVDAVAERVEADDDLTAVTSGVRTTVEVDGTELLVFAFESGPDRVRPTIIEGRPPTEPDEIALGAGALADLDRSIGDSVMVTTGTGTEQEMELTGRAVVPVLSLGETLGLADGAITTLAGLEALDPGVEPSFLAADVVGSFDDVVARYEQDASVTPPTPPTEILSYERIRRAPFVLALVLGILAAGVLIHAILTGVRRERRDLAVLRSMGGVRRQLRRVVAWQATTLAATALVIGVPLGIVIGRFAYRAYAEDHGVVADATIPVVLVAVLLVAVALVLARVIGTVLGQRASTSATADSLRPE